MKIENLNYEKCSEFIYKVCATDTFESIAKKFNVFLKVLKETNSHITSLEEGDYIVISRPLLKKLVVTSQATFQSIANVSGFSINEVREKNNAEALFLGQIIVY